MIIDLTKTLRLHAYLNHDYACQSNIMKVGNVKLTKIGLSF